MRRADAARPNKPLGECRRMLFATASRKGLVIDGRRVICRWRLCAEAFIYFMLDNHYCCHYCAARRQMAIAGAPPLAASGAQ